MENRQTWVKVLSLLAFSLVALNSVFAFANMGSTSFVQVFFILSMVAIIIASIFVTKESKVPSSVIGASILYFFSMIFRMVFFFIDAMVDFFRQLKLDNLTAKASDVTGSEYTEISNKITKLRKTIANDTFGEILDVFMLIFAFVILAIAVYHIVRLVLNKKFVKSFLGKFTCAFICKPAKGSSVAQENKIESNKVENEKEISTEENEQSVEDVSEEVALTDDQPEDEAEEVEEEVEVKPEEN